MLQNGAVKVFAIDVGRGQLDWKLRQDPRVVCMEKTNIRYVTPEDIGEPVANNAAEREAGPHHPPVTAKEESEAKTAVQYDVPGREAS